MNAAPTSQEEDPPREPFIPDYSEGLETGLYLALLELMDEGLPITSDEVVLEANSAACRLLEREYRELVGQPLESLFPTPKEFLLARGRLFIQGEAQKEIVHLAALQLKFLLEQLSRIVPTTYQLSKI